MTVLTIANQADPKAAVVIELCNQLVAGKVLFTPFDQLEPRSLGEKMLARPSLVVLQPRNSDQMKWLIDLGDFFVGAKKILILPDISRETITLAHRLGPSFLVGSNTSTGAIKAVLTRMIQGKNTHLEDGNGSSPSK